MEKKKKYEKKKKRRRRKKKKKKKDDKINEVGFDSTVSVERSMMCITT